MTALTYLNFDLRIERTDGRYRARVSHSPAGEATTTFESPFRHEELDDLLRAAGQTRALTFVGDADLPSPPEAVRELGGRLFAAVFKDAVQDSLLRSRDEAGRQGKGLRVRLRLTDVPELAQLPWEFLYDASRDDFLATSNRTPIVRYMDLPEFIQPLAAEPPLRILAAISSPGDYPQLDTEEEWRRLEQALRELQDGGRVVLERLEQATLPALQRKLQTERYHILHFVGHGDYDRQAGEGILLLETDDGRGQPVDSRRLGVLLRDHTSLRLVVLNACRGARSADRDPFSGTAQGLVRRRIPAVIAMQFEITDDAAITFAHDFYGALAQAYPVDAALGEARKAIYFQGNDVEWGTPVLFMRAPEGRIFDVRPAAEPEPAERETSARPTPTSAPSPEEADVYVSHSEEDADWVHAALVPQLQAAGITVVTDRDFPVGEARLVSRENAVEKTRHTLLVMTPAWIESEWGQFETLLTQTADPAARRRKLIPLMLKRCDPPLRIAMLNYADFTDPARRQRELPRLIRSLGGSADTQPTPTPSVDVSTEPEPAPKALDAYERELRDVVEKLAQRRLVLFVGADLPQDLTGAPSRRALAAKLARRDGLDPDQRFARIAQQVMQHGNRWEFTNFLKQELSPAGVRPGPFYRTLAELIAAATPELIVTTAYHSLLEDAARDTSIGVVAQDSALPFADPDRPTLLKLYGDVQQVDSLIVTEQDQNALLRGRSKPDMVDDVRRAFRRNSVLFLGYDLHDPAVSALFDEVAGDTFQLRSYAVWTELSDAEADAFESNRGLVVLRAETMAVLQALLDRLNVRRDT